MWVNEGEGEEEGEGEVIVVLVGWPFVASRRIRISSFPHWRAALDVTPIMTRWVNDSDGHGVRKRFP